MAACIMIQVNITSSSCYGPRIGRYVGTTNNKLVVAVVAATSAIIVVLIFLFGVSLSPLTREVKEEHDSYSTSLSRLQKQRINRTMV